MHHEPNKNHMKPRDEISRATFCPLAQEIRGRGGAGVPDARRRRELEDENRRLAGVLADQAQRPLGNH